MKTRLWTAAARLTDWDGSLYQLVALSAAFVLTGLSFGITSSAA
jgi:hypothetical protein